MVWKVLKCYSAIGFIWVSKKMQLNSSWNLGKVKHWDSRTEETKRTKKLELSQFGYQSTCTVSKAISCYYSSENEQPQFHYFGYNILRNMN